MRFYTHKPSRTKRRKKGVWMTEVDYALHQARVGRAVERADAVKVIKANKASKHRNVKVYHDGMTFDSKKELKVWLALVALQARGEISNLRRQVRFELLPPEKLHGEKRTKPGLDYVADYVFDDAQARMVVQDCKSKHTRTLAEYRTRKHMMKSLLGIDIEEV